MMARRAFAILALFGAMPAQAADRVSGAMLAQAARDATLDRIDVFRKDCQDSRRVEDWLKDVLGDAARSVRWAGGKCQLVNNLNPLDAGTDWCGRAEIVQKGDKKPAVIEVFFEKPQRGRPGQPFAFRATMVTKDGPDYMRDTTAFEVNWKLKYQPGYEAPANQDCD